GNDGGDQQHREGEVEAAEVAYEVLVVRTVDRHPRVPPAGERRIELVGPEGRPDAELQAADGEDAEEDTDGCITHRRHPVPRPGSRANPGACWGTAAPSRWRP